MTRYRVSRELWSIVPRDSVCVCVLTARDTMGTEVGFCIRNNSAISVLAENMLYIKKYIYIFIFFQNMAQVFRLRSLVFFEVIYHFHSSLKPLNTDTINFGWFHNKFHIIYMYTIQVKYDCVYDRKCYKLHRLLVSNAFNRCNI